MIEQPTPAYLSGIKFERENKENTYIIEKCYVLVRKNGFKNINSYHLSDFYLSLEEAYNILSPILRIDCELLNSFDKILEVMCVKLIVGGRGVIISSQELKTYSIKEVESLLIPF